MRLWFTLNAYTKALAFSGKVDFQNNPSVVLKDTLQMADKQSIRKQGTRFCYSCGSPSYLAPACRHLETVCKSCEKKVASFPDSLALVLSGARMTIPGARESGIIPPTFCHIFLLTAH